MSEPVPLGNKVLNVLPAGPHNYRHPFDNVQSENRTSVVEVIVMGDVDKDATVDYEDTFISTGTKKLFYLSKTPAQDLIRVKVGTNILQANEYCYDMENGWIMLASQPAAGVEVKIKSTYSSNMDMGITNWDQNKGNYLFFNTNPPVSFQLIVYISNGWNVLSIPGNHPDGNTPDNWWPYRDYAANVFSYNNCHQSEDTLVPGRGYWINAQIIIIYMWLIARLYPQNVFALIGNINRIKNRRLFFNVFRSDKRRERDRRR